MYSKDQEAKWLARAGLDICFSKVPANIEGKA
jgi:hypothetical protein